MSSSQLVLKARDRVRQARREGAPPGMVLERLLRPDATQGVALRAIADQVDAGERVSPEQGLWLLTEAPLLALGEMASIWRRRYIPEPRVTFVI